MYKINIIDQKIVDLLMEDGRMQAAKIARRIGGVSERAVRYRIENLIEKKIINVKAIVDPKEVGMNIVAEVWLEVESASIMDVAQKVAAFQIVIYVACSIGEADVNVQLLARNTAEVYRFVTDVIGRVPGVRKTTTAIVPLVIKDVSQWRIPWLLLEDNRTQNNA